VETDNRSSLARQWRLLQLLQPAPHYRTVKELAQILAAESYKGGTRTIERDLNALSLQFPIESNDLQKPYGWAWMRGAAAFSMPGMSVSQAVVLLTAQRNLQGLLPANHWPALTPFFEQAEKTLAAVRTVRSTRRWHEKVAVVPASQSLLPATVDTEVAVNVHQALFSEKQLHLDYVARGRTDASEYVFHPYGMIQRGTSSYLAGRIEGRSETTTLSLHRIQRARMLDADTEGAEAFELGSYASRVAAGFESKGPLAVELELDEALAQHLAETPLSRDQQLDLGDGLVPRLRATVDDSAQLRWWLLGLGAAVRVLAPAALAEDIAARHRSAAQRY